MEFHWSPLLTQNTLDVLDGGWLSGPVRIEQVRHPGLCLITKSNDNEITTRLHVHFVIVPPHVFEDHYFPTDILGLPRLILKFESSFSTETSHLSQQL